MGKDNSGTVVAQPNLFRMWNLRSRTRREGLEETSGLKWSDPQESSRLDRYGDDARLIRTMAHDDDLSEHRRSDKSKDEDLGILKHNEVLDQWVTMIHVEEGSSSNDNTTIPSESENTDSDVQSRQLTEQRASHVKSCSSKNSWLAYSTLNNRLNKGTKNSGNSQQEFFPLFKRKETKSTNPVEPETASSSDKDELRHRSKATGISAGKSSKTRKIRCTSNDRHTRVVSENFLDDASAGSSTQMSIGSQGATNERRVNDVTKQLSRITGGSQEQPIVIIDSSPVREVAPERFSLDSPPSAMKRISVRGNRPQNFFAPRKNPTTSDVARRKVGEGDHAEWPNGDNQHVRGAQHSLACVSFECPRRQRLKAHQADPSNTFTESIGYLRSSGASQHAWEPRYLVQAVSSEQDTHARCEETLKGMGRPCSAISRVLSADRAADAPSSSWNENWRPRCASEILGNEASSLYLKEWLLALELKERDGHPSRDTVSAPETSTYSTGKSSQGAKKRRQVIRTVDKPRKRRKRIDSDEESLGDWITSDEDETPLPFAYGEHEDGCSEDDDLGSPWRPRLTRLSRGRPPNRDELDGVNKGATAPLAQTATDDFSYRLTNTILLTGPSGSGKTATVYACAEELGWEVFEVNPGIGKRNGSSLHSLVGDVGKNHIVNRSSRAPAYNCDSNTSIGVKESLTMTKHSSVASKGDKRGASSSDGLVSFFSHKHPVAYFAADDDDDDDNDNDNDNDNNAADAERSTSPSGRVQASVSDVANAHLTLNVPAEAEGGDAALASSSSESKAPGRAGTQQSIILLEEVDILFSEDIHFWPTVIALIRESRRPVIMTCNDPTLVPSASLPLQAILPFEPCPPDLAVPYLQCIALKEGYALSEAHVKALYGRRQSLDALDTLDDFLRAATYPNPNPLPDLRCAINSLQFQCQGSHGMNASGISSATVESTLHIDTLNEASTWDWRQHFRVDCLPTSVTEPDGPERKRQHGAMSLWCIADSLSMIDSYLARRPTDSLEVLGYSTGDSSDDELGYAYLEYKPEVEHLQGGIVMYNRDEAIASEAVACAGRGTGNSAGGRTDEGWKHAPSLLVEMSSHFARVSGVLDKIVPLVARQSVGAVVLDYEPWVRFIDRCDKEQETAAMKEGETRSGIRGERATRNSQRQRVQYERYFGLADEERERLWWWMWGI